MEFENTINVASEFLGSKLIHCSDDFFAKASRMLQASDARFIDDKYDDNGKWMDGWETRRRRDGNNDFCFVKLGVKATINEFDIDTSHFTGNYAPGISILGYCTNASDNEVINGKVSGVELLNPKDLQGDSHNKFIAECKQGQEITHLKITIYPDGGIARFRAYGDICFDESWYQKSNINVIAQATGAKAIYANNQHFGKLQNILAEHEPLNMGDGWETRRRRKPGFDFGIIELARPAIVSEIIVDTKFFKGNFPDSFSICAANLKTDTAVLTQSMFWDELIGTHKLSMDKAHVFKADELTHQEPITHIRLNIFPDGGIARLKLNGRFVKL